MTLITATLADFQDVQQWACEDAWKQPVVGEMWPGAVGYAHARGLKHGTAPYMMYLVAFTEAQAFEVKLDENHRVAEVLPVEAAGLAG
ncbi:hypothetical protein LH450_03665 [Laribacter hongkongensis]|uniref:hypothetical protein n=1 Tax=Laribacter hongkongensis TaxID=168471 RepID=UPI001EFCDB7B|nr:hypothetical protein [Laribacter hongkongensis]MCG9000258.1 hypothetical protein [Laribacter hongkongensis]MCG9006648.1 hypothetical protein [Laribacter hongkongensis]MCG9015682.1 hypothetical protein [Laribacter hongkongensis]